MVVAASNLDKRLCSLYLFEVSLTKSLDPFLRQVSEDEAAGVDKVRCCVFFAHFILIIRITILSLLLLL